MKMDKDLDVSSDWNSSIKKFKVSVVGDMAVGKTCLALRFVKGLFNEEHKATISGTVMRIIKLKIFPVPVRLHSGYGKKKKFIISPFFAIFKNVVHSLEPGETPSYLASQQAPNYAQRS